VDIQAFLLHKEMIDRVPGFARLHKRDIKPAEDLWNDLLQLQNGNVFAGTRATTGAKLAEGKPTLAFDSGLTKIGDIPGTCTDP